MSDPTKAPIDQPPSFFARFSAFGWLCAIGGGAYLYLERASPSLLTLGTGFALVLLGGYCVDRSPLAAFISGITDAIKAWRGRGEP